MTKQSIFWAAVRRKQNEIGPGPQYITSIEDELTEMKGGVVCEVTSDNAALRIISRTHRLATPEEIAKCRGDQQQREEYCRATQESLNRESSLRMTGAFVEAARQLGPRPKKEA